MKENCLQTNLYIYMDIYRYSIDLVPQFQQIVNRSFLIFQMLLHGSLKKSFVAFSSVLCTQERKRNRERARATVRTNCTNIEITLHVSLSLPFYLIPTTKINNQIKNRKRKGEKQDKLILHWIICDWKLRLSAHIHEQNLRSTNQPNT